MISFRDYRPAPGRIETRSYTSTIVNALVSAAAGAGGGVASATAAVECAAGIYARGLALASVSPRSGRTAALTPSLLSLIGRSMVRHGEIILDISMRDGEVLLLPASAAYVTTGDADPASWVYTLTVDGPGSTRTMTKPRSGVVHLQHAVDPIRPWEGRAPWASAGLSGELLSGIETQLKNESRGPSGYILPSPDVGDRGQDADSDGENDPLTSLRRDMAAIKGGTAVTPTMGAGYGGGPGVAPSSDFTTRRFGMMPPRELLEARRDVERSILAACGVPPVLANHAAAGTSMREAWRQVVTATLEPLSVIVADQLSEALGVEVSLTMPRAADTATLARAVQSLTGAGMTIDQAREVAGL